MKNCYFRLQEKANKHNKELLDEICGQFETFMDNELQSLPIYLYYSNLGNAFAKLQQVAHQEVKLDRINTI